MELSYRNMKIWHKSLGLIKNVYRVAEKLPKCEEYNLTQQLRRAVVSVALNIAEGKSKKTAKEFSQFLKISCGSLHTVDAVLVLCLELGYLKGIDEIHAEVESLSKLIGAFRDNINDNEN